MFSERFYCSGETRIIAGPAKCAVNYQQVTCILLFNSLLLFPLFCILCRIICYILYYMMTTQMIKSYIWHLHVQQNIAGIHLPWRLDPGRARPSFMNESRRHHTLCFSSQYSSRLADLACMRVLKPHIVASHHRVHAVCGLKWQVKHWIQENLEFNVFGWVKTLKSTTSVSKHLQ